MSVAVKVQQEPAHSGGISVYAGNRRVRKTWSVTLSAPDANGWLVACLADLGGSNRIPRVGELELDTGLTVTSVNAEPEPGDNSGINWRVTVEYLVDAPIFFGGLGTPWTNKDRIEIADVRYQRPMTADFSDPDPKPVKNSAGDPPETPMMMSLTNPLLRVHRKRRHADFDFGKAKDCTWSLNQEPFTINHIAGSFTIPAQEALLHSIYIRDEQWTDGTAYVQLVIELELEAQQPIRKGKFQNTGFRELRMMSGAYGSGGGGAQIRAVRCVDPVNNPAQPGQFLRDGSGRLILVPTSRPCFLDNDGKRITNEAIADGPVNPSDFDREVVRYPTVDWSDWIT